MFDIFSWIDMYIIIILGSKGILAIDMGTPRTKCTALDEQPQSRINSTEKVNMLRAEMRRPYSVQGAPLEGYIVTTFDEHMNELLADRDKRLEYISGFSGTGGIAVVTVRWAALWVPEVYLSQADQEISCDWLLMNESLPIADWLGTVVQAGLRIGADPKLVPNALWESLAKQLNDKSLYLVTVQNNLVDMIWTSKPNYTFHEASPFDIETTGDSWYTKVQDLRKNMEAACDALIVTSMDEIAWLLDIRGRDSPYTPVLRSYFIISKDQLHLYTDKAKIKEQVKNRLRIEVCITSTCVRLHDYGIIWEDIATLSQKWSKVCLPAASPLSPGVSRAIYSKVPVEKRKLIESPILKVKAVKNRREREGMRYAHLQDGVAMCYTISYIQSKIKRKENLDELMIADLLDSVRRERDKNEGISFKSIVGFGAHSSLPHYSPKNTTSIDVNASSILLIDSGGQYVGGTTDVSRTLHFGTPTEEQKDAYTRILKGLIDVTKLEFPDSVTFGEIDIIARSSLWAGGKDYVHATGHGVGAFLSVHEGPILISRSEDPSYTLKEGNFFSIEPGYYKQNEYGIRLENILEVISINKTGTNQRFLGFNTVTLVPFELKLINLKMLSPEQISWLNNYNSRIREEVGAALKKEALMGAFHWMMDQVRHLSEVSSNASLTRHHFVFMFVIFIVNLVTLRY